MANHPLGNLGAPGIHDLWNVLSEDTTYEPDFTALQAKAANCASSIVGHLHHVVMDKIQQADEDEGESPPDVLEAVYNTRRFEHIERLARLLFEEELKKVITAMNEDWMSFKPE